VTQDHKRKPPPQPPVQKQPLSAGEVDRAAGKFGIGEVHSAPENSAAKLTSPPENLAPMKLTVPPQNWASANFAAPPENLASLKKIVPSENLAP
jgi:hypothetical protein